MTTTGQNLEMVQGDTRKVVVTVYDQIDTPLNITGCDITWILYKSPSTIKLTKTVDSGIVLTSPLLGVFEILLESEDTINLLGEYKHECRLEDVSNNASTIFTGSFKISASVIV
jgi:hypothetical protein